MTQIATVFTQPSNYFSDDIDAFVIPGLVDLSFFLNTVVP